MMFVKANYNEIYDLSTQSGESTILKFHTPQSTLPQTYLRGFFTQFRKYRYYGTKIVMIPAATLPADPLQISYEAGEPTIDPRDMVNPILHKAYHGEALQDDENLHGIDEFGSFKRTIFNPSTGTNYAEAKYYATLQDSSWKKSHVQRGFNANGTPLVRPVASNFQIAGEGVDTDSTYGLNQSTINWSGDPNSVRVVNGKVGGQFPDMGPVRTNGEDYVMGAPIDPYRVDGGTSNQTTNARIGMEGMEFQMFTSGFKKLGWLDTTQRLMTGIADSGYAGSGFSYDKSGISEMISRLPKVYMYIAMLPPAYKTEMYFRLIITHYFGFKDFRSASMPLDGARALNTTYTPVNAPAEPSSVKTSVEIENGNLQLTTAGVSA